MWDQPHYVYRISGYPHPILDQLETLVPGNLVYARGRTGNYPWRSRLEKMSPSDRAGITSCEVLSPVHGAWLTESWLRHNGLGYGVETVNVSGLSFWDDSVENRRHLESVGQSLVADMVSQGIVLPHVPDIATPYQFMAAAWADRRPWVMNVWPCGGGKTLGSLLGALTRRGPILVVCPAKARHVWWSQVQEYTTIKPYRLKPQSDMRKKDITLDEYLGECRMENRRPLVVIGAESLPDHLDEARKVDPRVLILDELHTHGSKARWKVILEADGTVSFEARKTRASGRDSSRVDRNTRAVAIMEASRLPNLSLRIGMTATPLDDGRPRRLWSQLDLLLPGAFSFSYSKFAKRYCAATPSQWGGLDDKWSSNIEELRARCALFTHEVPYSESHSALPSTRVQVVYLDNNQLNRADRWSDQHTFGQEIRRMAREAGSNPLAREMLIEARLAEACSRKRRFVVDEVLQGLRGGGKVVVFTARRRETEMWAHEIRRAASRGDEQMGDIPVWMGHGGVSETDRDRMVDAYRSSPGPCCLVGTGQAFGTAVDGMQTTDLAIFAMLPWKPGDFTQWKGRFDRLGGRATLLKVPIAVGTYDERVVDILVEKFGPIRDFLDADELEGMDDKLLGLEDEGAIVQSVISKLVEQLSA